MGQQSTTPAQEYVAAVTNGTHQHQFRHSKLRQRPAPAIPRHRRRPTTVRGLPEARRNAATHDFQQAHGNGWTYDPDAMKQ